MRKFFTSWTKLVFIILPLCIAAVDAAVLIKEYREPVTEKAIRLVRESTSRKENFTVQQYLYTTVYHRKNRGEAVHIEGWRATRSDGPDTSVTVEFNYTDPGGSRSAIWTVNIETKGIFAQNDLAKYLSWH
jgi:hypothetical protein